ncbi:MAG TPA: GNAT family N-acetyltransferase [Tepidisphaeraceae bacterium]|nr:GNAT family N-acetyltransferase [Tepidisphaeraceae bacterium]
MQHKKMHPDCLPQLPSDGDLNLVCVEFQAPESNPWRVPAYLFHMQNPGGQYMGRLRLRVGWNDDIIQYAGQIGYAVEPQFRGHHYAERACRLVLPLASRLGMEDVWITCQPDNIASRRTLERLGAEFVAILDVPPDYPMDGGAERRKMCFRVRICRPTP